METISRIGGWAAALILLTLPACGGSGEVSAGGSSSNPPGPVIAYNSSSYSFTKGVPSAIITPTSTGGAVSSWSVQPALPAGLTLDATSGAISGTPTTAAAATTYNITAINTGGQQTISLTLVVAPAPLLDVGHSGKIVYARLVGSALLTKDGSSHWVLWNYATGQNLASGQGGEGLPNAVDLEGSVVAVQTPSSGLQILSATDGAAIGQIPVAPSWWLLASDGSYIVTGTSQALTVYSTTGTLLVTHPGNYQFLGGNDVGAYAAPGQVQVALGPKGNSVIETIAVPSGTSSVGPTFQGNFSSWFTDGARFLTVNGNTVTVYSSASVQQDIAVLPSVAGLGGVGNYYYAYARADGGLVNFYAVGSRGVSSYTSPQGVVTTSGGVVAPGGTTVGLIYNAGNAAGQTGQISGEMTVVDLSGATPTGTTTTAPLPPLAAYTATSASTWVVGNVGGVLFDGASSPAAPRYLDYGQVTSIAGGTGYFAIATASGRVLYYAAGNTTAPAGTISVPATLLAMSTDGTVLATSTAGRNFDPVFYSVVTSSPVNLYSLPAGTLTVSYPFPFQAVSYMTLSGDGTTLGEAFVNGSSCGAQTIAVAGGATLWCDKTSPVGSLALSPDGTGVGEVILPSSSNVYVNAQRTTAFGGTVEGWLTPTTMLVNNFTYDQSSMVYTFTGAAIYNTSGTLVQSTPLPETDAIQVLSATSVYLTYRNTIYSVSSAAATWASGSQFLPTTANPYNFVSSGGAVSGSQVVFLAGTSPNLVLAEPYQ